MTRYVTRRPHGSPDEWDWLDFEGGPSEMTIHEDDDGPADTGLLNASGEKLYRATARQPMGFALERPTVSKQKRRKRKRKRH